LKGWYVVERVQLEEGNYFSVIFEVFGPKREKLTEN
jgi:hypothetical protein